jgi:CHAT domain
MRPASDDKPDVYPVEVTVDGSRTFLSAATISRGKFRDIESNPWEYGRQLGLVVFEDSSLERALSFALGKGKRVSLSLQIDPGAEPLQDLLWERLIPRGSEDPIGTSDKFTLSRRIPSENDTLPAREGPFRLLLVIASPKELDALDKSSPTPPIDLPAEIASLRGAWDLLVQRGLLQVSILGRISDPLANKLADVGYRAFPEAATLDRLADLLTALDGLHVISHGSFKNERATLLLENAEGHAALVSEEEFLPKLGEGSLRLVFLQACQSAARKSGAANVLSGLAPKLAQRAAAVVAMQDYVRIDDARRFAQEFYDTLLSAGYADLAANAGRRALYGPDNANWAIPALYLAPKADPLWQPDAVLRAVQDLAAQFRDKPEVSNPFPIEVIRQFPDISSKMETSAPGPRVRVLEAVTAALFPPSGARSPIVVIAANYGRAKSAQLYWLYAHYANQVSRDESKLPLFAHVSDFQSADDAPASLLASAISKTYAKYGIDLPARSVIDRLKQPFILCLDDDLEADGRRRNVAFDCLRELTAKCPHASAIVTLGEQAIDDVPALRVTEGGDEIPTLLIQLLSPATVAQYLNARGEEYKPLLLAIQRANLFDVAGVPWLLAQLIRQLHRNDLSRSGVIARVVNGNLASANIPVGLRRMVQDLLGRIAWALQTHQAPRLDSMRLYEVLDQVRGRREVQLEQLKCHALDTKILAPTDEDGVRFSYPGFQSYWCAQHILDGGSSLTLHLDDVTATLGRRNRVRLWEDTLVLLAGMMDAPDRLVRRILAGSSMSHGEHAFLAARCIHEAKLAGRSIADDVIRQVLDTLIWRSTPMKESSAAIRVRATECLALLKDPTSIPHLVSLAIEPVRPTFTGEPTFELSGLRHAALQVLLTMQEDAERYIKDRASGPAATGTEPALLELIECWRSGDSDSLKRIFETTPVKGLPAVAAFALATLGGTDTLEFLVAQMVDPKAAEDTRWSVADSLLLFDPLDVTQKAIAKMRADALLHAPAAYMIGRLRLATAESQETKFLVSCLNAEDGRTRGVALKALAQLGDTRYRELCEWIAKDDWDRVATCDGVCPPQLPEERMVMRPYAIESLRLIGTQQSLVALREARNWRPDGTANDRDASALIQLSYEVSEDLYWRLTGGSEGDVFDPADRPAKPR